MKKIMTLLCVCISLTTLQLNAQNFEVPTDYTLKVANDYRKYEQDVIGAAKWLTQTAFDDQAEKRKAVTAFVFEWINGSPTVTVELNATIMDFDKKNPGMLIIFMAGCARYVLENNFSKDVRAKHRAALGYMIQVYKNGTGIKKDKKMDKLIKQEEAGELELWLDENLKIKG